MSNYDHLQTEYGAFIARRLTNALDRLAKIALQDQGDDAMALAAFASKSRSAIQEDLGSQIAVLRQAHTQLLAKDADWQHGSAGTEIESFFTQVFDPLEKAPPTNPLPSLAAAQPNQAGQDNVAALASDSPGQAPSPNAAAQDLLIELRGAIFEADERAGGIEALYPVYLDISTESDRLAQLDPDQLAQEDIGEYLRDRFNLYGPLLQEHLPSALYYELLDKVPGNDLSPEYTNHLAAITSTKPIDTILEANAVPELVKQRFLRGGQGDYFFKDRNHDLAFSDVGPRLKTATNNPQVIESMVAMAISKGWTSLKIKGTTEFKARVWLAAQLAGLKVEGYRPTAKDLALLEHTRSLQQINQIEGVFTPEHSNELPGALNPLANGSEKNPANTAQTEQENNPFSGVLLKHGQAPFQFDQRPGAKLNYFATLQLANGQEHTHWGLGLQEALASAHAQLGQSVTLARVGAKDVEVDEPVWDKNNQLVGSKPIVAKRNEWRVTLLNPSHQGQAKEGALSHPTSVPTSPAQTNPNALIAQRLAAYQSLDPKVAMEQHPELVHVYALRKLLQEQAQQQLPKPQDQEREFAAIEKRLQDQLARGIIPAPNVPIERHFAQVVQMGEDIDLETGERFTVLQLKDSAGKPHSVPTAQLSGIAPDSLSPGESIELRNTQAPGQTPSWQVLKRDPAVVLHSVVASEWSRSLGANEAQAKIVGQQAGAILQKQIDLGRPLESPKIVGAPTKPLGVPIPKQPDRKVKKAPGVAR